ncbi:DUF4044 domain-containing protein [Enterococcus faecalis]
MNDKEQSRFSKITKVVVWLMLICICRFNCFNSNS